MDGAPCSPRQVSAGVPATIDSIICQALFQRHGRNGAAITTPIEFADALSRVAPRALPTPSPFDSTARMSRNADIAGTVRYGSQQGPSRTASPGRGHPGPAERRSPAYRAGDGRRRHSGTAKALISVVVVLVLAAVAAVAWSIGHTKHGGAAHASGSHSASAGHSTPAAVVLKPLRSERGGQQPRRGSRH